MIEPWDLFISHASEDKASFVDPLANRLKDLAVRVWYDKFTLVPGDRLSEKIAEGLARSRCGLLVVSKAFIGKPWPSYELSGLINRFVEEKMRLIPVWLDMSRNDVANFNPALADLFSIRGSAAEIDSCAMEILRVVRPRLHENLTMLSALGTGAVKIQRIQRSDIRTDVPIRHHDLPESLRIRIQNVWFAVRDVSSIPLDKTIENFQRDLQPEREVCVWERMVGAMNLAMNTLDTNDPDVKQQVFNIILDFSIGNYDKVFAETDAGKLDESITAAVAEACVNVVPPLTVSDVEQDGVSNDRDRGPDCSRAPPTPPSMRVRTRRFETWEQACSREYTGS
jgi:hypothetical protein